jgi:NAD(P)H-dependent FMN reductase
MKVSILLGSVREGRYSHRFSEEERKSAEDIYAAC